MNLPRPSNRSLPWKSGAEAARTPDASRLPGVSEPREAFGVRPIYGPFPSGAGSTIMVPMHAKKVSRQSSIVHFDPPRFGNANAT